MERAGHPSARPLRVLPAPGAAGPAMAEATLADGGVYTEGELKCEAPHGQGSCVWPDGSKYEGEWRSGKMHGKGAEAIAKQLKRLEGMKNKPMKPELKKWMMARLNILTQLDGKWEL